MQVSSSQQRSLQICQDVARFLRVSRRTQFGTPLFDVEFDLEGLREYRPLLCLKDDVRGRV
jgi:hypothetical protein